MEYLALGSQILGVILLYFASIQMPWSKQTWNGENKEEKTFRKRQRIMGITGLTLVIVGIFVYWLRI